MKDFFSKEKKSAAADKRSMQNYQACVGLRQDQYTHVIKKNNIEKRRLVILMEFFKF